MQMLGANTYPKVMYSVLGGISDQSLFKDDYHNEPRHGGNTVSKALLSTGNSPLLNSILKQDHSRSTFTEVLTAHFDADDLEAVLSLLTQHSDKQHNFELSAIAKKMVANQAPDDFVHRFFAYLNSVDSSNSICDNSWHTKKFALDGLWKAGRFELTSALISQYFAPEEQPTLELLQRMFQGPKPSAQEVEGVITRLGEWKLEDERLSWSWHLRNAREERIAPVIFGIHKDEEADIETLRAAIEAYEGLRANNKVSHISDLYDVSARIRKHYLDTQDFAAAEDFVRKCNDRSYYWEEIMEAKIAHAVATDDRELHESALTELVGLLETKEAKLIAKRDKGEKEGKYEHDWDYHDRISLYRVTALRLAEQVIFELKHTNGENVDALFAEMIENVEAIKVPGEGHISKRDQGYLQRCRRNTKKGIKERFLAVGLFDALPETLGWNHPIKDPKLRIEEQATKHKKRESTRVNRDEEEQREYEAKQQEKIKKFARILSKNRADVALAQFNTSEWHTTDRVDWERATLLIQQFPERYTEIFGLLSKSYTKSSSFSSYDWEGMTLFLTEAYRLGLMTDEAQKQLVDLVQEYRFARYDGGPKDVPNNLIIGLVKSLIKIGKVDEAWHIFGALEALHSDDWGGGSIPASTRNACYAAFIEAVDVAATDESGITAAFKGRDLPPAATETDQIGYWNTRAEQAAAQEDVEAYDEAHQSLLSLLQSPQGVRNWTKLMTLGSIRSDHQKKEALLDVHGATDSHKIRWRVVDTLINQGIVGAESMPEVKSKSTPPKLAKYFLKKLIEKGTLNEYARNFLTDEHLPYLRRLLAGHQNEFNTVMETLKEYFGSPNDYYSTRGDRQASFEDFGVSDWNGIFSVLEAVSILTPGVFAEARAENYEIEAVRAIGEKISALKKRMFTNEPLGEDVTPELQAEVIYAAFQPANMSLSSVREHCRYLNDCSHHLDAYTFKSEGYALDLEGQKTMRFRSPNTNIDTRELVDVPHFPKLMEMNKEKAQLLGRKLCELGRLKITDEVSMEDIITLFMGDAFLSGAVAEMMTASGATNAYKALRANQEAFGIYLEDNLADKIEAFFLQNQEFTSGMVDSLEQAINNPKRKRALVQQLGLREDENLKPSEVIAQVIIQKFKPLQVLRKAIRDDLGKFVTEDGSETSADVPSLRVHVSKNTASFFAKASSGICTAGDRDLFEREDHLHFNIIDENKEVCVGNLQAYIMPLEGQKYLLLRGFNPSANVLKSIDAASFCEAMIAVAREFVESNNLGGTVLSETLPSWHALSNRAEVTQYLTKKYKAAEREIPQFSITSGRTIKSGYFLK